MSSMCVHERSVYLWAETAFLKVSLFFFFFCKSTKRGTMWPWIASLLSQSFDRKVKKKNLSVGFSWSWRPHTISHISDPVWLSHFVLSIVNGWCICVYVFFNFFVVYWNGKLNWFQVCVWVRQSAFFYLVSMCWGLNWHSDSCFLDREWECVCLYERGRIKSGTSFYMNLPCCSARTLTHHFNFILIHKCQNVCPLSLYLCISTHWHAHRSVATVTP